MHELCKWDLGYEPDVLQIKELLDKVFQKLQLSYVL